MSISKPKATRAAFGEALVQLGKQYSEVVVCDADLSKSTKSELFAKEFPHRFFQLGIAEANMIGTGAGLALSGYLPFICSFGCFLTGRYDQIRMSVAYARAPVRLIGTHSGVGIGDDGHSQMGLEDLTLMRSLPTMQVFQPCDEIETKALMQYLVEDPAARKLPAYVRLTRQNLAAVHTSDYKFQAGKLDLLSVSGHKVAVFASGAGVQEALQAVNELALQGINADVINVHTIKPFDALGLKTLVEKYKYKLLVSVEDHYTEGGLGSVIAENLTTFGIPTKLIRLGVKDAFGESGEGPELYEKFGLSASAISATIKEHSL